MRIRQRNWKARQALLAGQPPPPPTTTQLVAELPVGPKTVLRVSVDNHEGKAFVNARQWYTNKAGEVRPTFRGLTVQPDLILDFARAVIQAGQILGKIK